ncbi:MAG: MMPL family transporter [Stenomitos rutilans HA7619-LM2]|jgi:RND superfamily putative drug exporter|nr:MMPL family transporter [Stenomitos rutilans HA7619-LM2]
MEPAPAYLKMRPKQPGFYTLGRLVYRYRKLTIVLWAILMALSLAATPHLEGVLKETGAVYEAGSAYQSEQRLQQDFHVTADALTLVFQRLPDDVAEQNQLPKKSQTDQAQIEARLQLIRQLPGVSAVISATDQPTARSADGQVQYSMIHLTVTEVSDILPMIDRIEQLLAKQPMPGWKSFLTGIPVVNRDVQQISQTDLGRIEFLVLPLTLMALLVVFGSIVAAILPVVMAVVAVSVTFGLLYLIALQLSVSVFALNLASMLGLGLGIDYALLIVSRFREELGTGTVETAIARTVETAGRAVFFSGMTVCIGLMGLLLFPITLLQSLGMAGSLVVLLSVVVALTLLPALLGLLGQRVQRRSFVVKFALQRQGCWAAIARNVIRHSIPASFAVLIIVSGLSAPFLQAHFGITGADILPKEVAARAGTELLTQAFGAGESSPILVLIRTPSSKDTILSTPHIATLYETVKQLTADPRVERVSSLFSPNPSLPLTAYQQLYAASQNGSPSELTAVVKAPDRDSLFVFKSQPTDSEVDAQKTTRGLRSLQSDVPLKGIQTWVTGRTFTLVVVNSRTARNSHDTQALVRDIQDWKLDGLQVWVAGQTARELDTMQAMYERFPTVLGIMMGVTFVILYLLLDSVVLPLKAIAMNVLSIGASFGALVFIFQDGHLQHWLHFAPVGYIDLLLPIVLFCVLFGLSMDYEVFMLTRIKETYDEGKSNTESVISGLENTGSIITSAALLMIIVTSAFVFSRIIFVKALGLGCAIAVLLDVTLIRAVLVPATMNLLGEWNWWSPRWWGVAGRQGGLEEQRGLGGLRKLERQRKLGEQGKEGKI